MSGLTVEGLSLRLGDFALRGIDLRVADGEILVLFGPNGAGKSATLEAIAGFLRLQAGRIRIAGEDVSRLPPEARGVGLVPQNYGLFPHLTVARNVMLPTPSADRRRAMQLLDRFGITALAERLPGSLSPGERQRAALARALAARSRLLLFDEPFAALDAGTRERLRDELAAFLRHSGLPAVFVTHDLPEAMALADRLAVFCNGRILQQGEAGDVYRRPGCRAVAALLGVENLLPGRAVSQDVADCVVAVGDAALRSADKVPEGGDRTVTLAVRAEEVGLLPPAAGSSNGANRLEATVRSITDLGALVRVTVDCGFPLTARLTRREAQPLGLAPGGRVIAEIAPAAIRVLPPY